MTIQNIDVEPKTYEVLSNILKMNNAGDETNLLLLHQRKADLMDNEHRAQLLKLVSVQMDQLQNISAKIKSVHLVDCGDAANTLHTEFALLGDLITLISQAFERDVTANVVLLDYTLPQDESSELIDSQIEIRNLLDPSVDADRIDQTIQVMENVRAKMNPDAVEAFDKDLRLGLEALVGRFQADSVNGNV
jgi:hypothetical protein